MRIFIFRGALRLQDVISNSTPESLDRVQQLKQRIQPDDCCAVLFTSVRKCGHATQIARSALKGSEELDSLCLFVSRHFINCISQIESNFVKEMWFVWLFQTCLSNLWIEVLPPGKKLFELIDRKLDRSRADVYVVAGEKVMFLPRIETND
jgi:hypothetical protein